MVLIFGGFGHDDDHNLMPVDSTPVNCGEDDDHNLMPVDSTPVNCGEDNSGWIRRFCTKIIIAFGTIIVVMKLALLSHISFYSSIVSFLDT